MSRRSLPVAELFEAARAGDRGALARLLSLVERGGDDAREVGRLSYPLSGSGYTVGLTGAPGAGKSTLTSAIIGHLRAHGEEVAVLAIDPSSPFTGGAILGDRVRMQDHATDPGVFIRSMATRGHLGGLSLATPEAVRLLDAVGRHWILVETVGVGQVEVEIAGKADTTVVVVNPGWGDSVQANKAGLMEIADVFVINKADRKGVEETRRDLEQMLELSDLAHDAWRPPIIPVVATEQAGRRRAVGHRARAPGVHRGPTASWPAAASSACARSCARSSPAASSSGPASSPPAIAGPSCSRGVVAPHHRPVGGRRRDAAVRRRLSAAALAVGFCGMGELVLLERRDDGVAVVTLNNPKVNALSQALLADLHEVAVGADRRSRPAPWSVTGGERHLRRRCRHQRVRRPRRGAAPSPRASTARSTPSPPSRGSSSPPSAATRSVAGASWRWRATTASPPSGPCSASPRSCSASSPVAAARSGWPARSAPQPGQGADDHRPSGEGRGGAAHRPRRRGGGAGGTARAGAGAGRRARGAVQAQALVKRPSTTGESPLAGGLALERDSSRPCSPPDSGDRRRVFLAHGPGKAEFTGE